MREITVNALIRQIRRARTVQSVRAAERRLLARLETGVGNPIVEGDRAHFFYRSANEANISVTGDWNKWQPDAEPLVRLNSRSILFHREHTFPIDAALPYRFVVDGESVLDPMNQLRLQGPLGTNSFFSMPGYSGVPHWHLSADDVPRGRLIELYVEGNTHVIGRTVGIYIPHGHELKGPQRFLYVNDGAEAITIGRFNTVLDNLYHFEPFEPKTILVFVPPVDRHGEYILNTEFAKWFANDLTKQVERKLKVTSKAALRGVQGASLGGLFASYIGLLHSSRFSNIVCQSPSFWVEDFAIVKRFEKARRLPLRFYLHTGTIQDAEEGARKMLTVLQNKGYALSYHETNESHNWANWAGQYAAIVRWMGKWVC
jgi:enterochelin esterase-like enzyme